MSQINSQVGIDASQALSTLAQLKSATDQYAASVKTLTGAFKRSSADTVAIRKDLQGIKQETERLTTSLGLLSRIVFTQAVVRGLSQMRRAFSDTGRAAIDFQRQVALIRTLDDSGASFQDIAGGVRQLSDDLNISLADAGAGVFNAISNQVGNLKQSLDFSREAAEFSKATGSTMADSVDLLSGVLKSYNLTAADTDKVSTSLFKVIDLGRITADQLANSFGRVGPVAADLGVDLDELGAAISAISVKGSNTPETLTQMRGILSALVKPSDAMKARLAELGFDSGQAAVQTLGLAGTLTELNRVTGGSAAEFGRLFPNVRAMTGSVSLLSDGGLTLAQNIQKMAAAGRDFSKSRFLIATATDAEKLTAEANKLKNALTVELGQSLLQTGVQLSQFVGGAENVVGAIDSALPAVAGLGTAFVTMRASTLLANAGLVRMAALLGPAGIVAAAAGASLALRNLFQDKVTQQALSALKGASTHQQKVEESFLANEKQKLDAARASDKAQADSLRKRVQEANKLYQADLKNATTAAQSKAALDKFQGAIGFRATSQEDALRQIAAGQKGRDTERLAAIAAQLKQVQATAKRSEIDTALRDIQERAPLRNKLLDGAPEAKAAFNAVVGELDRLSKKATVSGEEVQKLNAQMQQLAKGAENAGGQVFSAIDRELPVLATALAKINEIRIGDNIKPGIDNAAALRTELEGAAQAIERIKLPSGAISRALGGQIDYRAMGGRGTDTIPAMLSRGEFVVNARSARQFFPQLQAINAGRNPVYRSEGGPTNVTVGDVNVNNHGGPAEIGLAAARQIKQILRREVRRGL